MSVFKGSTEVGTEKMVILKGSTAVGGRKMVVAKASTAVDGGKMTVGKASTAVFCGIWPYFRFPPQWTAKYGRFSCFHRGFLPKMTVGGHFHRGGRQNMRIFPISTAVDDRKWPF